MEFLGERFETCDSGYGNWGHAGCVPDEGHGHGQGRVLARGSWLLRSSSRATCVIMAAASIEPLSGGRAPRPGAAPDGGALGARVARGRPLRRAQDGARSRTDAGRQLARRHARQRTRRPCFRVYRSWKKSTYGRAAALTHSSRSRTRSHTSTAADRLRPSDDFKFQTDFGFRSIFI